MLVNQNVCFVIADGGHARFVKLSDVKALYTVEALDSAAANKRTHDLVTDRPGRSFESSGPTRHGYTPRHDPHDVERHKFGQLIGTLLRDGAVPGGFDALVLVAPADVLKDIIGALDAATEKKVAGTLDKDLVKVPDHELQPHLAEWVRPPTRG